MTPSRVSQSIDWLRQESADPISAIDPPTLENHDGISKTETTPETGAEDRGGKRSASRHRTNPRGLEFICRHPRESRYGHSLTADAAAE
jgi:hypothetical protein